MLKGYTDLFIGGMEPHEMQDYNQYSSQALLRRKSTTDPDDLTFVTTL